MTWHLMKLVRCTLLLADVEAATPSARINWRKGLIVLQCVHCEDGCVVGLMPPSVINAVVLWLSCMNKLMWVTNIMYSILVVRIRTVANITSTNN